MKINWFPGHMNKALNEMRRMMGKIDVVIYLLDSRAPISSINPSLNSIASEKGILYIFNKIDLADEERVKLLAKPFKKENSDYVIINSTLSGAGKSIRKKINTLAKAKIEKFKAKGIKTTVRALVVGVPNSGKSTFVNNLCGKAKTQTGDRPGVTKIMQWLNIGDNIELCDTPGTLYPNLQNPQVAEKLAFIGSIKEQVIDNKELSSLLLTTLQKKVPHLLEARYGKQPTLESIAEKRGYVRQKGVIDYERTALAILDDFRKGRIGKITLD